MRERGIESVIRARVVKKQTSSRPSLFHRVASEIMEIAVEIAKGISHR